jgi:hypothetical protein
MAAQDSSGPDTQRLEAMSRQLDDLERRSAELSTAISRGSQVRLLLTLAVVVIVVVTVRAFWKRAEGFVTRPEPLIQAVRESAQANEAELQRELKVFIDHAWPPVQQAFSDRFNADWPNILTKFGEERDTLAINLRDKLEAKIRGQVNETIQKHRQILAEEFPDIKDEEVLAQMIANMQDALQPMVKRYYAEPCLKQIQDLFATWDDFPLADRPGELDPPLDQQLHGLLYEIMRLKVTTGPEGSSGSSPRPGGA